MRIKSVFFIAIISLLCTEFISGQSDGIGHLGSEEIKKGIYISWGYNASWFSRSNIHFKGEGHDFSLFNVYAKDKPSKFDIDVYFNPAVFTVPQYNFRIGYYRNEWEFSIGLDHMKYVMQNDQTVKIDGYISNTGTAFDNIYDKEDLYITDEFLIYEHTDGLNHLNVGIRRKSKAITDGIIETRPLYGIDVGVLIPKTNTTFLRGTRYDDFHLSGYGLSSILGVEVKFWDRIFIRPEFKTGFINMPDILTSADKRGRAKQSFVFYQLNAVLGATIKL